MLLTGVVRLGCGLFDVAEIEVRRTVLTYTGGRTNGGSPSSSFLPSTTIRLPSASQNHPNPSLVSSIPDLT
jgi:hypothetical protein